MDRAQFVALRDQPDKRINGDISFQRKQDLRPQLMADATIERSGGPPLRITMLYNPETGTKGICVIPPGAEGPVCRLDVDGQRHRDAGRSHKHALQTPECPRRNLPDATARPELSGLTMKQVFDQFCSEANIVHAGTFHEP